MEVTTINKILDGSQLREIGRSRNFNSSDKEVLKVISNEMNNILKSSGALGVAAPQLGFSIRIITVKINSELVLMLNPLITYRDCDVNYVEGCLSYKGLFKSKKSRSAFIEVEYLDKNFIHRKLSLCGLNAIVVQHEIDHLDGVLLEDNAISIYKNKVVAEYALLFYKLIMNIKMIGGITCQKLKRSTSS